MLFSSGQPNWNPFLACRDFTLVSYRTICTMSACFALLSALGQRNYTAKYSLSLVRNADYIAY